ncbi:hypothetical protein [Providencia stuartii]|uniref:hypothetical protein n=1 Tax=Providencia stuartii TaxID=588 RepID=UPI00300313DA
MPRNRAALPRCSRQRRAYVQDTNERINALLDKRQVTSDELKKVILDVLKDITEHFVSKKKQDAASVIL